MRRCQPLIKIIFLLFFMGVAPAIADDFLSGTEDVPLMQDLALLSDETFDFDTEDGRFYSSKAVSSVDSQKVLAFYRETLPQLGWKEKDAGVFVREDDVLRITATQEQSEGGKITVVVFELVTKSK